MAMSGQPFSRPSGASTSTLCRRTEVVSNPFSPSTPNNPFGVNQAPNLFGNFSLGETGSLSRSGTLITVFRSSELAEAGASSSAFRESASTPAFGSPGSPTAPAVSAFGGFGTTPSPADPFGAPFGLGQAACGSQPFGSAPTGFGFTSSPASGTRALLLVPGLVSDTPAFGALSTPAFRAPAFPPFDFSRSAFGTTSVSDQRSPAFGASSTPAFGKTLFGVPTASPFGAQTYGAASTTPAFEATTVGAYPFGGQRGGSRVTPYAATDDDPYFEDSEQVGMVLSIDDPYFGDSEQVEEVLSNSAMPAYSLKSPEELKWEEYQAGVKGGPGPTAQTGSIFNQTAPTSLFGASTGLFSQQTSTAPNPFATAARTSIFEQKPATGFGATFDPAFGAASTSAFGSAATSTFGQNPATGFGGTLVPAFGAASTSAFGSTFGQRPSLFGTPSTGAAFGQAIIPAVSVTASPFGVSVHVNFA